MWTYLIKFVCYNFNNACNYMSGRDGGRREKGGRDGRRGVEGGGGGRGRGEGRGEKGLGHGGQLVYTCIMMYTVHRNYNNYDK